MHSKTISVCTTIGFRSTKNIIDISLAHLVMRSLRPPLDTTLIEDFLNK